MEPALEQLSNRLRRVHRHRRKWARRTSTTCYRLYEKDLADQPLIVDWYDGEAVVWAFPRTRSPTPESYELWFTSALEAVAAGLDLPADRLHAKRRGPQSDRQHGGQYQVVGRTGVTRVVHEGPVRLEVNLSDYVDTGLFLDHRPTRTEVGALSAGRDLLNLFAYTGAFTCHAVVAGARRTVSVDLSHTYLAWAARNLALNGVHQGQAHDLIRADCVRFLSEVPSNGGSFDIIVCDPPTFSNSKSTSQDFQVGRDHRRLIEGCLRRLNPGGTIYFSTNFRGFRLDLGDLPLAAEEISERTIPEDFRDRKIHACWRLTRR